MEADFRYTGDWFLPNCKKNKCKGVLVYNVDEGLRLEVYGNFNGEILYRGDEKAEVIFGILNNGERISLYNTFSISSINSVYTKSGSEAVYRVNYCFIGIHIVDPENINFSKIRFNIFNTEEWFDHLGFKVDKLWDNNKNTLNVNYTTPNDIDFEINSDINCTIKFGPASTTWVEKGLELSSSVTFEMSSKKGSRYTQMRKYLAHIEGLFSYMFGTALFSENVNLDIMPKRKDSFSSINIKFIGISKYHQTGLKIIENPFCLVSYKDIGQNLPNIISNWFTLEHDYHEVINVIIESFANNNRFSELNFWNLTRVAEGFDRMNVSESQPNVKNLYLEKLNRAIYILKDNEYPYEEIIKKIGEGLKYGYEPNLRDRLSRMVKAVNSEPIKLFIGGNSNARTSFVHNVVNIRNKFTHPDQQDTHYDVEKIITLSVKLRLLVWYHFMIKIGIKDEIISRSMINSNRLKFW